MTGETGSTRYMAPEVHFEKPYNQSVDVYSFSILVLSNSRLGDAISGFDSKKSSKGGI